MSNRGLLGGVAALLLLGVLCVCLVGMVFAISGSEVATLQEEFGLSSEPRMQVATPVPTPPPTPTTATREPIALPSDALAIIRAEEDVLNQVYEATSPSVVNISVSGSSNSLFGELGEGSGWVWDSEGHIVTNNHVVANAETVFVTFSDGSRFTAEVIGTDEDSDLAVIQVAGAEEMLVPLVPGESATLRVGQRVIAIGNPFGFEGTMTLGVVSATERTVPGRATETGGFFQLPNLVQTDAAINPGNSGGPLLDVEGRVVGVNTLIYSQNVRANSGVGFAVPIDKVKVVVPSLIEQGVYETPYLGLNGFTELNPELAELLEVEGTTRGLMLQQVMPGGPSDRAGLRGSERQVTLPDGRPAPTGGDIIIAINERTVNAFDDLINYLDTRAVGEEVTLTIIRDGERMEVPVTLGARP